MRAACTLCCCFLFDVCCRSVCVFVGCCLLCVVRRSLFAVRCSLFVGRCSLFVVRCSLFVVVCSLLFAVVCWLLLVVCCLWFWRLLCAVLVFVVC